MDSLDVVKYEIPNFSDPYKTIAFLWELLSIAFNSVIIYRALNGWLINPRITRQVVFASSLATVWILICLTQFFIQHRVLSILNNWTGYPLTLLVVLQHIELLKLFVSLSDYWTDRKCRIFQYSMMGTHVALTFPEYIWPFGLENDRTIREVTFNNKLAEYCAIPWVGILIIVDNICAIVSIRLMWKHLLSLRGRENKTGEVPTDRYYKVVVWIAAHASLDIVSLILFSVARTAPGIGEREQMLLDYLTTPVVAYHVGCYPFVYCGVRDLKFHEQIKELRSSTGSKKKAKKSAELNSPVSPVDASHSMSTNVRKPRSLESQNSPIIPLHHSRRKPRSEEPATRESLVAPRRFNSLGRKPRWALDSQATSAGDRFSPIVGIRDLNRHGRQHQLPPRVIIGAPGSRPRSEEAISPISPQARFFKSAQ